MSWNFWRMPGRFNSSSKKCFPKSFRNTSESYPNLIRILSELHLVWHANKSSEKSYAIGLAHSQKASPCQKLLV